MAVSLMMLPAPIISRFFSIVLVPDAISPLSSLLSTSSSYAFVMRVETWDVYSQCNKHDLCVHSLDSEYDKMVRKICGEVFIWLLE